MLESRILSLAKLAPAPPLNQFMAAPAKSDVSAQPSVGDWVCRAASALLPHPTCRNTPPLGEFLGRQNFTEEAPGQRVLCSELCSSAFHSFLSIASGVWRFAEPPFYRIWIPSLAL
jgi:hypothetical protein